MSLNKEQLRAAHHVEGPMLVIAGAGSGKTKVVTHRIAYLIEIGIPASDIISVTFTNKAALEMKERVKTLTSQNIWTSTFHSLCARILKESIHFLGFKNSFSIYDVSDTEQVLKHVLHNLNIKAERGIVKTLKRQISNIKNQQLKDHEIDNEIIFDGKKIPLNTIFNHYQSALKEYNALDFDDLLFKTVELFQSHPNVLESYQRKWPFLLIDEYQDTNHAQYLLSKLLVGDKQNIFAVGDPDQSIYSWRGANVSNILNFEKDFPGAQIIQLQQNYRSVSNILNGANSLIENNEQRYEKQLWSSLGEGEKITIQECQNDLQEAQFITKKIRGLHQLKELNYNQIGVLYRTNAQSRSLEDALLANNIPYKIVGGISFYDRKEIKDLIAFLKLLVSPHDFIAFSRIINLLKLGIGPTSLQKIQLAINEKQESIIEFCKSIRENNNLKIRANQKLNLYNCTQKLANIPLDASLEGIIETIIKEFSFLALLKEDPDTYNDRRENIEEFLHLAYEFQQNNQNIDIQAFLEHISLNTNHIANDEGQTVNLMTLHNSKGLEFDAVFLIGMEEGLLPHVNSFEDLSGLEEERRLCYVGMTRAKQYLFLTYANFRYAWGKPKYCKPSRFLCEINKSFTNLTSSNTDENNFKESHSEEITSGSIVYHKTFGKGKVNRCFNTSLGLSYEVHFFEQQENKTLVAKYAKLRKDF